MAKKKTVKKVEDKVVPMSKRGLSDTTTTINTDTVKFEVIDHTNDLRETDFTQEVDDKTEITSNTRVDNEIDPVFTDGIDTAINVNGSVSLGNPNPSAKLHIEGTATGSAPVTTTTDFGIEDELSFDDKSDKPEPLTNEELTQIYMQQNMLNQQLIEKQYILEWKIFGQEFKGKYIYLQIDKEMFIFGTSVEDVKYISAETPKEAFAKYIDLS